MKLYLMYLAFGLFLTGLFVFFSEYSTSTIVIVSISVSMGLYFSHVILKEYQRLRVLEYHCDPETYIRKTIEKKKEKGSGVPKALFDIEIATGLCASGEFEAAKEVLNNIELKKISKINIIMLIYYNNLAGIHLALGELSLAKEIFDNYVKNNSLKHKRLINLLKISEAEFLFHEKKYDESRKKLQEIENKIKSKRHKLEMLFLLAQMEEFEGNHILALEKYKKITDEGNKLWIASQSKEKCYHLNH